MTKENEANEEGATKSSRKPKDSSKSISDSVINRSTIKVETHHHHYNSSPELESEPKIELENTVESKEMGTHADALGRKALVIAFIINLIMMSVDLWYGLMMKSASLLGDAANNSGDVFILGSSILVLSSTTAVKNRLALFKGIIMTVFGLWAFYHVYLGLIEKSDLTGGIISIIGVMSLVGNASVAFMMYKHQHKDINFMSAFICCRNDAFASAGIILAGLLVMYTGSFWPDIIIGTVIAIIVCHGGIKIIRMSLDPASAEEDCECC